MIIYTVRVARVCHACLFWSVSLCLCHMYVLFLYVYNCIIDISVFIAVKQYACHWINITIFHLFLLYVGAL